MNFLKNPEYSAVRMFLLVAIIVGVGYFAYTAGHGDSLGGTARVVNTAPTVVIDGHAGDPMQEISCMWWENDNGGCGAICSGAAGGTQFWCGTGSVGNCGNMDTCTPIISVNNDPVSFSSSIQSIPKAAN